MEGPRDQPGLERRIVQDLPATAAFDARRRLPGRHRASSRYLNPRSISSSRVPPPPWRRHTTRRRCRPRRGVRQRTQRRGRRGHRRSSAVSTRSVKQTGGRKWRGLSTIRSGIPAAFSLEPNSEGVVAGAGWWRTTSDGPVWASVRYGRRRAWRSALASDDRRRRKYRRSSSRRPLRPG